MKTFNYLILCSIMTLTACGGSGGETEESSFDSGNSGGSESTAAIFSATIVEIDVRSIDGESTVLVDGLPLVGNNLNMQ